MVDGNLFSDPDDVAEFIDDYSNFVYETESAIEKDYKEIDKGIRIKSTFAFITLFLFLILFVVRPSETDAFLLLAGFGISVAMDMNAYGFL
jgi:hypothetical protein